MEFAVLHSDKCLQTRQMHIRVLSVLRVKNQSKRRNDIITVLSTDNDSTVVHLLHSVKKISRFQQCYLLVKYG